MTLSIAKVNLIYQESHRKRAASTEVVILIPDMDMLYVHLNAIKERGEERETDGLLKLLFLLRILLFCLVQTLLTLFSFLGARLAFFLVLIVTLLLLLLFALSVFGSHSPVHLGDIDELILAIVLRIYVPCVVLFITKPQCT